MNIKKHALLFAWFWLISTLTIAQSVNVTGSVMDPVTQKPLVGATVTAKGQNSGTVTDSDGKFSISINRKGPLTLRISMVGYEPQTVLVTDPNSPISLLLNPSISELDEVVVGASRVEERLVRAPVTIEKNGRPNDSRNAIGYILRGNQ
ncbi:carboxypeptidase-like regulatory domain-containing protein [Spirosoma flavus]